MKILVVDDEEISRKKMRMILDPMSIWQVVVNGNAALVALREAFDHGAPYDLITLDIMMPDLNGLEVLTRIRAFEKACSAPPQGRARVIMVTSHSDKQLVLACVKAGCDGFIVKPFTRDAVLEKLASLAA